jgi:hypothetical protein
MVDIVNFSIISHGLFGIADSEGEFIAGESARLSGEVEDSRWAASSTLKYFFLSDGWLVGRVWELGGLWNENAWRRKPQLEQMNLSILENGETFWLYRVEDAVIMVEVKPGHDLELEDSSKTIGQVVLRKLITADQAIERLCEAGVTPFR